MIIRHYADGVPPFRILAAAIALTGALTACGDNSQSADEPEAPPPGVVVVADMKFTPASITVSVGDTVTWRFDDGGIPHNVQGAADAASLIHSPILRDAEYSVTFDKPGTYQYTCTLHSQMTGVVVVE